VSFAGNTHAVSGDFERAVGAYETALRIARSASNKRQEGEAQGFMAAAFTSLGAYDAALDAYEAALKLSRELGQSQREVPLLQNMRDQSH